MNAARRAARTGRNLLIALVLGAVIIVAIVASYVVGRSSSAPSATRPTQESSTSPADDSIHSSSDAAPTGCLGGTKLDTAMVLATQSKARPTSFGAVEVAASFFRWTYRAPHPSSKDVASARAIFVPTSAETAQRDLEAEYRRNPNPSGGVVDDGTSFHLTTVGARWTVQGGAEKGQQRVSVLASFVVDGAVSPTKTAAEAIDLRLVDGRWRVVGLAQVDAPKLAAGGTAFSAGC